MKAKNINLCDVIKVLAWNMHVRIIEKRTDCEMFAGLSYKIPEKYFNWEVWEIKQTLGGLIVIVEEV